jgi:hypothetical protein
MGCFRCRGKWRARSSLGLAARSNFDIELIKPRGLSGGLTSLLSVLLILRTALGIVLLGLLLAARVRFLIGRGVVFRLRRHDDLDSVHRRSRLGDCRVQQRDVVEQGLPRGGGLHFQPSRHAAVSGGDFDLHFADRWGFEPHSQLAAVIESGTQTVGDAVD